MYLAERSRPDSASLIEATTMTPFQRVIPDATTAMDLRNAFLAQPPEFFNELFGGRPPTLVEKLYWIEERVRQTATWQIFQNNIYRVVVEMTSPLIHLCIRRHDGRPCKDWNHMQQIKTEIVGAEHEGVELFPAESRLINVSNEFHLWVHPKSGYRFPFGFSWTRFVMDQMQIDRTSSGCGTPRELESSAA